MEFWARCVGCERSWGAIEAIGHLPGCWAVAQSLAEDEARRDREKAKVFRKWAADQIVHRLNLRMKDRFPEGLQVVYEIEDDE